MNQPQTEDHIRKRKSFLAYSAAVSNPLPPEIQKQGIQCVKCGSLEDKVLSTRATDGAIRRRRECLQCANRVTTYEMVANNFMDQKLEQLEALQRSLDQIREIVQAIEVEQ